MSDWDDEPKSGRGFDDQPAKSKKEVSGWSDDEGNEKSGGGGGGAGGGYRKGGENSGGYRGRLDDQNFTKLPPISILFNCNKDGVAAFIKQLRLYTHNITLEEVRELRDNMFTAFKHWVNSEWVGLEKLDREEERVRKAQKTREEAATIVNFIMDVNGFLGETEMGKAQEQLKQMGINWEEHGPTLDTQEIVLPQTTSASTAIRNSKRSERSGVELETEPSPHRVKPIIDIFERGKRLNEEQHSGVAASRAQGNNTVAVNKSPNNTVAVNKSPQTYGSSKFVQHLSEGVLNSHKMRGSKYINVLELSSTMAWPTAPPPPSVWSSVYQRSYHIIHSFIEVPTMKVSLEPPQTAKGVADNTSSIHTSRQIDAVVRHHRSQNQNLETPDGAYFSRYEATRDEEAAWSAAGGITGVIADHASSSTPIKRLSEFGYSLPSHMNLSIIHGEGSTSTPGAPPMPPEFLLGSVADSGTLMMTVDNEETAMVGAASISKVRSARLDGVTPVTTPLHCFRPPLPVINEEQHHLHQPLQHQQRFSAIPRMLEMTTSSPPYGVAEPPAIPPSPGNQRRDWDLIFRPRDQIVNYVEGSATPRARRRRRARHPATVANSVETPQERIPGEVPTTSSQEITKSFMANLLQKAADAVSSLQHNSAALAPATFASTTLALTTPAKSAFNPGSEQGKPREIEKCNGHAEPLMFKSQTNDESAFQQPRCYLKDTTMATATKEVLHPSPASAASKQLLETLEHPTGFNDTISHEKLPELNTSTDLLNISEIHLRQPCFPTIEHMEIDIAAAQGDSSINSLVNLSASAIVKDVHILNETTMMATSSCNPPDDTANLFQEVVGLPEMGSKGVMASELVELEHCRAGSSLYDRESIKDLSYIVQHVDMVRLNIDLQKELSLPRECPESPSNLSMPAVKVYDPKTVVNIPDEKIHLLHKVLGALVMQPQVDMHNAGFIQNRMDAAKTFRILLDLKAANIINLSKNGQIFSLK